MFNWSSQEDVFGVSDGPHHKWVGIDPMGGYDPFSPNIVWGNEDQTMESWVQLGVIAQAKGEWVTVFVREQPEYSSRHNDVLLDDAELFTIPEPVGGVVVQPVASAVRAVKGDNTTAEKAIEIGPAALSARIDAGSEKYQYYKFKFPGGDVPYKISIQASPDDGGLLNNKFSFRVYGPRAGHVYTRSGYQRGLRPIVTGDLIAGEPGV